MPQIGIMNGIVNCMPKAIFMRKLILVFFVLGIYYNCFGQTKSETYEYLNEKLEMYKLDDIETNYVYIFQEVEIDDKEKINFLEICTIFKRCSTAYFLNPKDYSGFTTKDKTNTKWIEIFFKPNSIENQQIDLETRKRYKGVSTSRITIILDKSTPEREFRKIKKAFLHLLKLYGVEKKDLFD